MALPARVVIAIRLRDRLSQKRASSKALFAEFKLLDLFEELIGAGKDVAAVLQAKRNTYDKAYRYSADYPIELVS